MIPTLVVIVLITVVGISVLSLRYRASKGIESGITSFRRELRALAPEHDERPRAHPPAGDPPRTSGVGILRPDPDAPVPPGHPPDGGEDVDGDEWPEPDAGPDEGR